MLPVPFSSSFMPLARAMAQLDDPAFLGVLARSMAWSATCFGLLYGMTIWIVHRLLNMQGPLAWTVDLFGSIGAILLAFWLFLPVAAVIGTLYFNRIAIAVERRFYPMLPAPQGAPLIEQIWDGLVVGLRVLLLETAALVLVLMLPGVGLFLGWMIGAFAIGRSLFVAVAMRRMPRSMAEALYRSRRGVVLVQGAMLAMAAYVPMLNLLIPLIGTAAMVHILDVAILSEDGAGGQVSGRSSRIRY